MILYLLFTLFACQAARLLYRGQLVTTLGVNLSDASFDSGSESAEYMITLDSTKASVESGDGTQRSSSIRGLSGVTMADMWRLTSDFSGGADPISSNLEQVDDPLFGSIGSAMTQSSGVFSFPTTGIYLVRFTVLFGATTSDRILAARISTTSDNGTSWDVATSTIGSASIIDSSITRQTVTNEIILEISDISNQKCRFSTGTNETDTLTQGDTDQNETHMTFIRLGDT